MRHLGLDTKPLGKSEEGFGGGDDPTSREKSPVLFAVKKQKMELSKALLKKMSSFDAVNVV